MTGFRYFICDVFTDTRFGGNQLAVLPDARGLSDTAMQQITREFNFSESTFVLPPEQGHTRRVRIFTPRAEIPFAGHPNIGTAFALATAGELGSVDDPVTVTFEERAGLVPVTIQRRDDGVICCELSAPAPLTLGAIIPVDALAAAASLSPDDVVSSTHPPQVASVGLPFVVAELRDRSALERARPGIPGLEALASLGIVPDIHLYVHATGDFDLRARMFAPFDGVPEDPATGSANCALAALLGELDSTPDGTRRWRIAQGVEMGRPSVLEASVVKRLGRVVEARIGGASVLVSEGTIHLE